VIGHINVAAAGSMSLGAVSSFDAQGAQEET
jgi:hypothetical protein